MNPNGGKPGNSGGKKGRSGRKSLMEESRRVKELEAMWYGKHDFEKLMRQVKGKLRSPSKIWLAKLLTGNDSALKETHKRLFPEQLFLTQDGQVNSTITHEFIVRRTSARTERDAGSSAGAA